MQFPDILCEGYAGGENEGRESTYWPSRMLTTVPCQFEWVKGRWGYYCDFCMRYLMGWEDMLESDEEPEELGQRLG